MIHLILRVCKRDSDPKLTFLQNDDDKSLLSKTDTYKTKASAPEISETTIPEKEKPSHLTLIVSNPTQKDSVPSKSPRPTAGFSTEVWHKGERVYQMLAQDPSHYLKCEMTLKLIEKPHGYGICVICHFPNIADEEFNTFVSADETLYGNLMIQFQMSIMEQLLLFCRDHNASGLVIYVNDDQAEQLGAYENIAAYQERTLTDLGEKTLMAVPTNSQTFDKWIDFMEATTTKLQQGLWLDQRFNPVIREYLKSQQQVVVAH